MAKTELKPCPKCGSKKVVLESEKLYANPELTKGEPVTTNILIISCQKCGCMVRCFSDAGVKGEIEKRNFIAFWNKGRKDNGAD